MCGCNSNCDSLNTGTLPTGLTGDTGDTGAQGVYGGFSSDWIFNGSTGSGPASTNIRLNNATPASVTHIFISNVNSNAIDVTNFLLSFSNNSKYGYIRLFKETNNTLFWYGEITAVTNNVTEIDLTVTYIDSNSTFTALDPIVVTFSPAGEASPSTLSNNTTDVATSGGGTDALMTYTVPANTLKTNEDVLEIEVSYIMSGGSQDKNVSFTINGANFITKLTASTVANTVMITKTIKYLRGKISITRKSATAIFITCDFWATDTNYFGSYSYHFNEGTGAGTAIANLSSNTLVFACFGSNIDTVSNTETITQNQLAIKYFNK